ncbi:MAG: hypothetical protein AB8I58_02645, partial [Anaerolineales bacterium]
MKKLNKKYNILLVAGYMLVVLSLLLAACSSPTPEPTPEPPSSEPQPAEPASEVPEVEQSSVPWNAVSEAGTWVLMGYGEALNPTVVEPG